MSVRSYPDIVRYGLHFDSTFHCFWNSVLFESSVEGVIRADEESEDKKKRRVMSLLEKVEVLDKMDGGMGSSTVGRRCDVNKSMILVIKKNEYKFREER